MFLLLPDNIWKSGRMTQIAKEQVIVIVIVIARIGHSPWGFQDQFYNVSSGYWVRSDVSLYKAPQAAAISPLLISPARPIHVEIDHNTGNYVPYSFRQVRGFFNVPC